jgi:hypothetical protein
VAINQNKVALIFGEVFLLEMKKKEENLSGNEHG